MTKNFQPDLNKPTQYDELAARTEEQYGLPKGLAKLVMMIENRNDPKDRTSPAGAEGVMQIMPANKKALGITDSTDPEQAFMGAGKLLSDALGRYNGNIGAALADYNGGPRAAERYLAGKDLHPETAQYLEYAQGYMGIAKPTKFGNQVIEAGIDQATQFAPSDLNEAEKTDYADFITGLDAEQEAQLKSEAEFYNMTLNEAVDHGFGETLTSAIAHVYNRESDPDFNLGDEQFQKVQDKFPQGLSKDQESRIYNSRSASDFDYNVQKTADEFEFGKKAQNQTGWNKAGMYAGVIGGSLFDPVALPAGTFGLAGRAIKGGSVFAGVSRMAVEGAAATAIVSPAVQLADKGEVSSGELLQHMGMGAAFGAGLGFAGKVAGWSGKKLFDAEVAKAQVGRANGDLDYTPNEVALGDDGLVVNFRDATSVSEGPSGEIVGVGPTAIRDAAHRWDESVSPEVTKVLNRRRAYYGNQFRLKTSGLADSPNIVLANSSVKEARFVGSQWAGDASGLGKQSTRTAAVIKEQMRDVLEFEHIPALKEYFEAGMTPREKLDYAAGGAQEAQARYSRAVQLERYRHREYRKSNENSSEGYQSEAPAHIQQAAKQMDTLYGQTRDMHVTHGTEHANILKDSDPIGYIEQRPDYIKLNKMAPEQKKAMLDMVKDDYQAEVTSKLSKFKQDREAWIEAAFKRAEANMEAPWVAKFLENPEQYFDVSADKLSKKLSSEMNRRASHWWENALSDPEARYQNSEASLLTLAKEMAGERLEGQTVDSGMIKDFADALTTKWADTSRRELNMGNSREVNGERLYLLDMFNHDVFSNAKRTIADTSGRVGLAKLGWRTEQDIADTLTAMRHAGVPDREIMAAKHISDIILNRAKGLDDSPAVQAISNITHAAMMGKLGASVLADMPMAIGNLGIGGMMRALGGMAHKVIDGSMFVRNGRLTKIGSDLDVATKGMMGHDNELWIPQQVDSNGMAMEMGGSLLRRTAAGSRFTNTMSGANALTKMIGTGVTRESNRALHKTFRTGKGISEARLADIGIHKKEFDRIKAQFDKYSSKEDFGLDKWDDPLAVDMMKGAAHRFSQQSTMNRQYAGDLPQWTRDTVLGYLYSKFRAIGIKAQEKVLVRNLTLADSNTAAMMIGALSFATFLSYARIHADAATSKDGKKMLKERLTPLGIADQVTRFSSVMGLGSEVTNLMQTMTGGGYRGGSDTPITGAINTITAPLTAPGKIADGNWKAASQDAIKLVPGSNTYQMMMIQRLLDE